MGSTSQAGHVALGGWHQELLTGTPTQSPRGSLSPQPSESWALLAHSSWPSTRPLGPLSLPSCS